MLKWGYDSTNETYEVSYQKQAFSPRTFETRSLKGWVG